MTYKKKLIEVALPLEAINKEAAREKSIRHGHPSTLHLWWARRPLAACRAVLFAQLVDDPSAHPDKFPTEKAQEAERQRLFTIIEDLVKWDNVNNETVLEAARNEIRRSTDGNPPPVYDPFCGGGSIPLEAQRLGLKAYGSDLNPMAVLITKALIEIPPKFAGKPPVNPDSRINYAKVGWQGAKGLAEDIRYYGKWMREEAEKRIGHLYPKVTLPKEHGGGEATVIAWLWARTVKCPNPACGAEMPLVRSFDLSTKKGDLAHIEPIIDKEAKTVRFDVKFGGKGPEGTVNRRGAHCVACGSAVPFSHVRAEGQAKQMSESLMAIVAVGNHSRTYLSPNDRQRDIAKSAKPVWKPNADLPHNPRDFKTPNYGMTSFSDLFTNRQLIALTTFSDLVSEAREKVLADSIAAGMSDDRQRLEQGGTGAQAYADATAVYLGFGIDKMADTNSTLCTWQINPPRLRATFGRQALPMTWDYAEANIFGDAAGDYKRCIGSLTEVLDRLLITTDGYVFQRNAASESSVVQSYVGSTDPPYYDNIGYADLSDYFYIWSRRTLHSIYPNLLNTVLTPKEDELVATPYRYGGSRQQAQEFFEKGLRKAFQYLCEQSHYEFPFAVYYAFKQSELVKKEDEDESSYQVSTGWETMLDGLIVSGFCIVGTWPMRSELATRNVSRDKNALASSIVLVCRPRPENALSISRGDFLKQLKGELPDALRKLQQGNIAPVDLAQAAIGPGMAVYSRYTKVLEADGSPMTVRTALGLINQELEEYFSELEGEFEADTRWALTWFQTHGTAEAPYGEAETLATAKNISVKGMEEAGIIKSKSGKVQLLARNELPKDWDPEKDKRLTTWESAQHLIRALDSGEQAAARLLAKLPGGMHESVRDLAYRLYNICERKKWSSEALAYNSLVTAWPELVRLSKSRTVEAEQGMLL